MAIAYHTQKNKIKGGSPGNEETFYYLILEEPLSNGS
jgi:hypothetical protein